MAKVIPVGPIDPVLYGFAKKQAEKAERDPRYVPKRLETPAHSITYRRAGATVKAFVIDKIAPITFSSPGSAIPIRPNFLHLNKTDEYSSGIGNTKNYIFDNAPIMDTNNPFKIIGSDGERPGGLFREIAYNIVNFGTSVSPNLYMAGKTLWRGEGEFPNTERPYFGQLLIATTSSTTDFIPEHYAEISTNKTLIHSQNALKGTAARSAALSNSPIGEYFSRDDHIVDVDYTVSGTFLTVDIRDAKNESGFDFDSFATHKEIKGASLKAREYLRRASPDVYHKLGTNEVTGAMFAPANSAVAFDGGVLFPVVDVEAKTTRDVSGVYSPVPNTSYIDYTGGVSYKTRKGISKNLSADRIESQDVLDMIQSTEDSIGPFGSSERPAGFGQLHEHVSLPLHYHIFVAASVAGLDGVLITAKVYESYSDFYDFTGYRIEELKIEKTKYPVDSALRKHRLARYFYVVDGEYSSSDAVQASPPSIIAEGICLQHAWFFCGANEALNGVYGANDYNHISVVVYPQGKHQFAVDEAEIFSVKLNHTPIFVARPGGTIELAMYAVNNGSPLVPYVVRGLVEELDEDGNPTDFYLAADGEISGTFEQSEAGHGTAKFKLSPHQKLDAYRLISVETTTTRQHGVQAHIEVLGPGVRVPPGPPSITIESLHPTVLAGQTSAFYVTATHMAEGSRIKYEIRSAGTVISSNFTNIAYGAGVIQYIAPHVTRRTDDSRFVLSDPLQEPPTNQPSTQNFEIELIHENAPEPVAFSVKYAHERYVKSIDRPEPLLLPELFYLSANVAHANSGDVLRPVNIRQPLVHRVWCSIKTKRVYVTFWDGKSCEVSNILKKNPGSGKYEFNPDWKEMPFDYPPAVEPFAIKGALEPYVYAYMDYEASLTGE